MILLRTGPRPKKMGYSISYTTIESNEIVTETFENTTALKTGFAAIKSTVKTAEVVNNPNTLTPTLDTFFSGSPNLVTLDLNSFDTNGVTVMASMFSSCPLLTKLDLRNFNTSAVIHMAGMFQDCTSLSLIKMDNLQMNNLTLTIGMFSGCNKLSTEINIPSSANITDFAGMFAACATEEGAQVIVWSDDISSNSIAAQVVATKTPGCNVIAMEL